MALKYKILADALKTEINHRGPYGERRLPTEAELMERYQVSRQTVRRALSLLADEGLIDRRQGSGSYISSSAFPVALSFSNIALFLPEITSFPAFHEISEAQTILNSSGYSVQVYCTENRVAKERELLLNLLKQPVRGLLAIGVRTAFPNPNLFLYKELIAKGTSIVFLGDAYPELSDVLQVSPDHFDGGELLTRHLLTLGHKKIAGIFPLDDQSARIRYAAILHTLCEKDLSFDDRNFLWYDPLATQAPDTKLLLSFIRLHLADCTAVICQDCAIARQLIPELNHMGISVPQRVSVAAFDTVSQSAKKARNIPRITCASCTEPELLRIAAELLLARIDGKKASSVQCSWTIGQGDSTASPE
ncbi:MAG: GntR family transcriptional regulator [Clostridiales bacterium]|nr:GntR family transcriptional regulator [Clostridiales bacterium]